MAYSEHKDWDHAELRKRSAGIAIALLLEALLIIAILSLSMQSAGTGKAERSLTSFFA